MFSHILLPTDGTPFSEAAIDQGVAMARLAGARITGLHVKPEFHILSYRISSIKEAEEQFAQDCELHARQYLARVRQAAEAAGVPCDTVTETSDIPSQTICQVAERLGCDLILMASHGRRGLASLLIGSETQRVLTHSKVPVMVWR